MKWFLLFWLLLSSSGSLFRALGAEKGLWPPCKHQKGTCGASGLLRSKKMPENTTWSMN